MSLFTKSDLKYEYQWETTNDNPALRGEPDRSLFNRHQGWEVLYMCNKIGESEKWNTLPPKTQLENLHLLEGLIYNLHSNVRSQEEVAKILLVGLWANGIKEEKK